MSEQFVPSRFLDNTLKAQPRKREDIVAALIGYINGDPYFKTDDFADATRYVLERGMTEQELYVPFDGDLPITEDKNQWTEDYLSFAMVDLKDNFCPERIAHVKAVASYLRPQTLSAKKTDFPNQETPAPDNAGSRPNPCSGGKARTILIAVAIAAALITISAFLGVWIASTTP